MKKDLAKILCVVLSVLLMAASMITVAATAEAWEPETFPLWVEGIQVTAENRADVLGDGKVRFEPETGVLQLTDGAVIESGVVSILADVDFADYAVCIASELNELSIKINGNVTIKQPAKAQRNSAGLISCGNTSLIGKGSLTVLGGDADGNASYAVVSVGALKIGDGISLTAKGGDNASASIGILAYLDVEMAKGAEVTALGGTAQKLSAGIYCALRRELKIDGAKLNCKASAAEKSAGICADLVKVESGEVTAEGADYGHCPASNVKGKFTVKGGSASVIGKTAAFYETEIRISEGIKARVAADANGTPAFWDGETPLADARIKKAVFSNEAETAIKGDINGDGTADALDAALILQKDSGLISLNAQQIANADLNGDGTADAIDAAKLLKLDAGLAD